jgi:hemerythrin-like metal-binding protein
MPIAGHTSLSTGVREIDRGTEGLCYVMGRLFEPLVECRRQHGRCDRTECTRLTALLKYMGRNFALQEQLMVEAGYPHEDHHRRDHWRIIEQLRHMRAANVCADADRVVVSEVVERWILEHSHECDRRLGNWALTRRVRDPS